MTSNISDTNSNNLAQIKEHYELEKSLASRLLNSTKQERQHLYTALYDELFTKISFHPQLSVKADPSAAAWIVAQRVHFRLRASSIPMSSSWKLDLEIVRSH